MAEVRLYDSTICRLCAADNDNGEMLFTDDSEDTELSAMVNRYLPLKIHDDGKYPRTICPGCNIQLEATVQFFDLVIDGQRKIEKIWKQQVKADEQRVQRGCILNNSDLINESFTVESDDDQQFMFDDGSLYGAEHDLTLRMAGLDKPKKKRGRPAKCVLKEEEAEEEIERSGKDEQMEIMNQEECKQDDEFDGDDRRRRKIKVPKRYMGTVQGKELEKIFKEEGVFDEPIFIKTEPFENFNAPSLDSFNSDPEIIGRLVTPNGRDLNEPVVNKNKTRINQQKSKTKKKQKFTCSFCGKGFSQRSKYVIHKSLHKAVTYECAECKNQFSNKQDLLSHQKDTGHDVGDGLIKTGEKNKESNDVELKNNVASTAANITDTNKGDEEIKNTVTGNLVNIKSEPVQQAVNVSEDVNSKNRVKVVHKGEKPFTCPLCAKGFVYQTSLQGHMEIEHSDKSDKGFPCDLCGKILNHPSSITYHKLTEHNDGRLYECNKCSKRFKHKQLLQRHQIVHSENRPFPCDHCSASFKTKANLLNHQSTHTGEKKHCCTICDTKFAHKTSLTLHYRTHTGQKPYRCEVCAKSFSQNGNLQEHMRIHTGEKPYTCNHCGRKFTTSSQFKLHVKRHTGERPWKCSFCEKSFLHKDTWKCHVRRHTGERPYQCDHCQRKFTEQWALKKHLRLHTGEKPYHCDICGKAFADCSNLTKHKKVHKNHQSSEPENITADATKIDNGLWHILKTEEDNVKRIHEPPVTNEDDLSRIFYVTYQNPNSPNESITLQINKENLIADQDSSVNEDLENFDDNDIQFSIVDADGNPIRLSAQQARQLLSDGQFLNQTNTKLEILPDPIQSNDHLSRAQTLQTEAEDIVKILQDEDDTDPSMSQINTEEQVFELITSDGQKVQYIYT